MKWFVFGLLLLVPLSYAITSEDVDNLCDVNQRLLFRENGEWGCESVTSLNVLDSYCSEEGKILKYLPSGWGCAEDQDNFSTHWEEIGNDIGNTNHGHDVIIDDDLKINENLFVDRYCTKSGLNCWLEVDISSEGLFNFYSKEEEDMFWTFNNFSHYMEWTFAGTGGNYFEWVINNDHTLTNTTFNTRNVEIQNNYGIKLNGAYIYDWSDIGGNGTSFDYDNYFNQTLNTTDDVVFNSVTAENFIADLLIQSPRINLGNGLYHMGTNGFYSDFGPINVSDDLEVMFGKGITLNNTEILDWSEAGPNTTTNFASITSDVTSLGSTTMKNPFKSDTYTTYTYTTNAISDGITYENNTGIFRVEQAGNYQITAITNVRISSSDEVDFEILINNVTVFDHDWFVHSSVDPVERTISVIKTLAEGDNITLEIGTTDGVDSVYLYGGNTMNINQIAGGYSGAGPDINYSGGGGGSSFDQDLNTYDTVEFEGLEIEGVASTTNLIADNLGSGDPGVAFHLSNSEKAKMYIDDSDSDKLKIRYGFGDLITMDSSGITMSAKTTMNKVELIQSQSSFGVGDTTPSVKGNNYFKTTTGAVTITQLDSGATGQMVTIIGGATSATTINDGGNFCMAGNFVIGAYDSITFLYDAACWIEISRSNN